MHLEIERKWLIAYPDTDLLAAMPSAEATQIVQTYLTASPGLSRRVRARSRGDETVYTRTTKRRISATTAEEEEAIISVEEYESLLREADPTCRPIEKTRWCIPHGALTLEIDIYPFWQKQAVLEIELQDEGEDFAIPKELCVLREVSDDIAYKNVSLAKKIPPEDI